MYCAQIPAEKVRPSIILRKDTNVFNFVDMFQMDKIYSQYVQGKQKGDSVIGSLTRLLPDDVQSRAFMVTNEIASSLTFFRITMGDMTDLKNFTDCK